MRSSLEWSRQFSSRPRWTPEERLLLQVLRGELPPWPPTAGPRLQQRLLDAARRHGVVALVQEQLFNQREGQSWPEAFREALPSRERQVACELLKERELRRVVSGLLRSSVQPLLMKGAVLAYTHYRSPHLRPRLDTDLFIPEDAAQASLKALKQQGYERVDALPGDLVFYEFVFSRKDGLGLEQIVDLHWKLSRHQLLADCFSYDELARHAVAVRRLGEGVRGLDPVHSLLVALMHRVAHAPYGAGNRLIWIYDIHLLATAMLPAQWDRLTEMARSKGLSRIALDGLRLSQEALTTPLPSRVLDQLATAATAEEPPSAYLSRRPWQTFLVDLRALPDWKRRLQLAREHLFPPPGYMRKKYRCRSHPLLPLLYVYRILVGFWKYL